MQRWPCLSSIDDRGGVDKIICHSETEFRLKNLAKRMFVYIITNHTNSVIYTGVTNNLIKRIWEHKNEVFENSFSKNYRLYKLIWFQEFREPIEAIEAEKKIKGWKREKKMELIKSINPNLIDLSVSNI